MNEQGEQRYIESAVKQPGAESTAALTQKVRIEQWQRNEKAEPKLYDLDVGDNLLPARPNSQRCEEKVKVHHDVNASVYQERNCL